jgi:hypothetical protein
MTLSRQRRQSRLPSHCLATMTDRPPIVPTEENRHAHCATRAARA